MNTANGTSRSVLQRIKLPHIAFVFACVAAAALMAPAFGAAQADVAESSGVHQTTSCLGGNGRFDTNIVNRSGATATFRIEYEGLTPRQRTLDPMDWWRSPVTGRADGDADVVVKRDGIIIAATTASISCDSAPPVVSEPEIEVISACRGDNVHRGYLLIQLTNASDSPKPYVIEFDGVSNRSTTAAAWGQAVRAVTGRPSGTYNVTVTSNGELVDTSTVTVDCAAPEPTATPTPPPTATPGPVPTPPPSPADGAIGGPGRPIGGVVPPPGGGDPEITPQAGTLTAADVDDNLNLEFFSGYLDRTQAEDGQTLPPVTVADRITLELTDPAGDGLANAKLELTRPDADGPGFAAYSNAAGTAYLFPTQSGAPADGILELRVTDAATGSTIDLELDLGRLDDDRSITVEVPSTTSSLPAALDAAFVIDTTGSMGDELEYLKVEFTSIVASVKEQYPGVDMRFGLVAYRDIGDEYITRVFDFAPADEMLADLADQSARGGGDYPEAMEVALTQAAGLTWRDGDVSRVVILNADAPPHDENLRAALAAGENLRAKGVRIHTLAASGVADTAEYLMRTMAATTGGRHLFLTDDSGVGGTHQEPKVACYVVTRLDQLLVRVLATELAGERIEAGSDQIIRTVGDYDNGECGDVPTPPPSQVIGEANVGGEIVNPRPHPIDSFVIAESFPEQITVTYTGPPVACSATTVTATVIDEQVVLSLITGQRLDGEDIACVAIVEEHQLTMRLTEGLLGRPVVLAPIAL